MCQSNLMPQGSAADSEGGDACRVDVVTQEDALAFIQAADQQDENADNS